MTITAKIIEDSIGPSGKRITTMELRYPRFIHAEFMTHRVFSRNASSSRAIPVETMIDNILDDMAMPVHWGKNQPGMQADEECNELVDVFGQGEPLQTRERAWGWGAEVAADIAMSLHRAGYHKQVVNRLLEPFMHITVVVTATEWENFYGLRAHPDAQPEIQALALAMRSAQNGNSPVKLGDNEWHLPYITNADRAKYANETLLKLSTARCARVSYLTHDKKEPTLEADLKLYGQLITSTPAHASPCEHQARPASVNEISGNFVGWTQHRKLLGL